MKPSTPKGTLFLLPNTIGSDARYYATEAGRELANTIKHYVVEEVRSARRLLRALGYPGDFGDIRFYLLNQHSKSDDYLPLLMPLLSGTDMAIISEAGLPCVADPGGVLVALAHSNGVRVVPYSGPSSIMLTLMASGFNGQVFTFNGYLPKERAERVKKIKQLEQQARSGHTQLFMDTPYRNMQVLADLISACNVQTELCIAANISCADEHIKTQTIGSWKSKMPELQKRNVIFALGKSVV